MMKQLKQANKSWVLVNILSGIPVSVEAFRDKKAAELREKIVRKRMHPENDETGVFEVKTPFEQSN